MSQRVSKQLTCLVVVLVCSCLVATPLLALPPEKERWIELSTEHFTLYSALSRPGTQEIALRLEQLRAVLALLTPWDLNPSVPIYIYIFSNDKSFTPYKNWYRGKTIDGAGYFLARPNSNFIAINGGATHQPEKLLYHEYIHHVVASNSKRMPLWLNEGLAELYSTFKVSGRRAEVGRPIADHVALLQQSQASPLAELFVLGTDSAEYNEGARRGVIYAESWLLVHYLMVGYPERGDRLSRYLELVMTGQDVNDTFHGLLATGAASLERELRSYVRRRPLPVVETPVKELDASSLEVRSMAYSEVLGHLGHLLVHLRRDEAAAEHLEAALQRQPGNALALTGLADLAHRARLSEEGRPEDRSHGEDQIRQTRPKADGHRWTHRYNEALRLVQSGDREAAKTILKELITVSEGSQAEAARTLLEKINLEKQLEAAMRQMNRLLAQRRPEQAIEVLRQVDVAADSPEGRWIEDQITRIQRKAERGRFNDQFNQALEHLEAGDAPAACRLLERLLATLPEESSEAQRALVLLAKARAELN